MNNLKKIFRMINPCNLWEFLRAYRWWFHYYLGEINNVQLGEGSKILPSCSLRFGENIKVGANSWVGPNCFLWAGTTAMISIGDNVLIGPNSGIYVSNHGMEKGQLIVHQNRTERDVTIGSDVWFGANCVVLPGSVIKDGSVIGAGSVVNGIVEAYSIVAGNPAKRIGNR